MPVRTLPGGNTLNLTSKSITFTGAASLGAIGNVPIFTVTGQCLVAYIVGYVTTNLTGTSATIALGVTGSTSVFIGATTATGLVTTAAIWASTTPTAGALALAAAQKDTVIDANIVGTVAVAAVASGVLRIDCYWLPLGAGATVS